MDRQKKRLAPYRLWCSVISSNTMFQRRSCSLDSFRTRSCVEICADSQQSAGNSRASVKPARDHYSLVMIPSNQHKNQRIYTKMDNYVAIMLIHIKYK